MNDPVNHPQHYRQHPSGVEAIQITEHFNFCIGNAIKYLWRADAKGNALEDLEKAAWYVRREIERRRGEADKELCHCGEPAIGWGVCEGHWIEQLPSD